MPNFKHSGDLGDIIYSMPTIRALGGGTVYLNPTHGKVTKMTLVGAMALAPLLEHQDYIDKVKIWNNENVDYDIDSFRWTEGSDFIKRKVNLGYYNLADAQLDKFNLPRTEKDRAWISVDNVTKCDVVFARSARWNNPQVSWGRIWDQFHDRSVFVGIEEEHKTFIEKFGDVPFVRTDNFLELARIIAGSTLFIGNQSSPYAVAEGLKVNSCLEVYCPSPNCNFERPNLRRLRVYPRKGMLSL